jgi:DNA-binding beta-propeller fold protein YncE
MNALLCNVRQIGAAAGLTILVSASLASCQNGKDERGGSVLKQAAEIPLPGPAVRFDYHLTAMKIIGGYKLAGIENPHGIAIDQANRLVFIAGEENHSLTVFDLNSMRLLSVHQVGDDPDVLAFDPGLGRLYVSAEPGTVTVMQESNRDLKTLGQCSICHTRIPSASTRRPTLSISRLRALTESPC